MHTRIHCDLNRYIGFLKRNPKYRYEFRSALKMIYHSKPIKHLTALFNCLFSYSNMMLFVKTAKTL